jgi:hypothetical protein
MPLSALPPHLRDIENNFEDDDQYKDHWYGPIYRWFNKKTKTWFAFSFRCPEWWAKWRQTPIVLFALRGNGCWRAEHPVSGEDGWRGRKFWYGFKPMADDWYLSRQQLYCRWHIAIQWPLMVSVHWYPKQEYVPVFGEPKPDLDGKYWNAYWNHYDADNIFWMLTSIYIGTNPK